MTLRNACAAACRRDRVRFGAMSATIDRILGELTVVERLRAAHAAEPAQRARVMAVKDFQSRRFGRCYADLLADPRYRSAARFFLDELYGPFEFADRDAQFARVVPSVVRLFPAELGSTLEDLAQLHAMSERLDDRMARFLEAEHLATVDARAYVRAWQATGEPESRRRQIALTLGVGRSLDRHTRHRLLRLTLRMMRAPARAAGLGALQRFLEVGFDAFAAMNGASWFLSTVDTRERALADALETPASLSWALSAGLGERPPSSIGLDPLP